MLMSLQDPAEAIAPVSPSNAGAPVTAKDRRRPYRLNRVSPHLIALLRRSTAPNTPTPLLDDMDVPPLGSELAIARGFGLGLVLSVPIWSIIGLAIWAMLR